jgi:hypothetical protein
MKKRYHFLTLGLVALNVFVVYADKLYLERFDQRTLVALTVGVATSAFIAILETRFAMEKSDERVSKDLEATRLAMKKNDDNLCKNLKEYQQLVSISVKDHSSWMLEQLKLQQAYSEDGWLKRVLWKIVKLREDSRHKALDREAFEDLLNESIERATRECGKPHHEPTRDDEHGRMYRLKDAVDGAYSYVYAVTFDVDGYLERFWDKLFAEEYFRSNKAAAARNVDVERIFVVSQQLVRPGALNDPALESKSERFSHLIRSMSASGLDPLVIELESLPPSLSSCTTSFFICDDEVASESHGQKEGKQVDGYICYREFEKCVAPLKRRFERLREHGRQRQRAG